MSNYKKTEYSNLFWYYDKYKCWWYFKWLNLKDKKYLIDNLENFIEKYVTIAEKYKILMPNEKLHKKKKENIRNLNQLFYDKEIKNFFYRNILFLYTENSITAEEVNDIETYKDVSIKEPIYIWNKMFDDSNKLPYIYINISNDVFFSNLRNPKTRISDNKNIKKFGIDNSELAYLNTTRFNSFFRDFKKLCLSYGAEYSYEIDIYETEDLVSPEGIFIDGEIIYYEDIVDMLDEEYKIVDLSINTDFKSI